jgi:hypothetical protein
LERFVVIEMNQPGIWILGSTEKPIRESGLGVVVEYAGKHGQPLWIDPPRVPWDPPETLKLRLGRIHWLP